MQYKREYIWALVGRFLPLFVYLGTTMILARFLSPKDFGMIGVLSIFFVVANVLVDAGLGGSLIKEKTLSKNDCSSIFVFNLVISHLLYILLFLFSGKIEKYFNVEGLALLTKVLCLIFLINSWGLVSKSLLTRNLQFRDLAIIGVVGVIIASLGSVSMAILGCGVYALVGYQILNSIVTTLLSIKYSGFVVSFTFSIESLKRLLPFGIYTTLSVTIDTIYENLITFLFGKYLSIQQAGYMFQAKRLEEVPTQAVSGTINNVAFPVLSKLKEKTTDFQKECDNIFKTILLLTLPILFVIALFSAPIMLVVFGKQWVDAAPYLSQLVIAAIFVIAETLNRTFIKSTGQVDSLFKYTIIKRAIGILLLFMCLLLNPYFVIWGYVASSFVGYLFNAFLLSNIIKTSFARQLFFFLKIVFPSLFCYGVAYSFSLFVSYLWLNVAFVFLLYGLYILAILPFYGIHVLEYMNVVKSHVFKNKVYGWFK